MHLAGDLQPLVFLLWSLDEHRKLQQDERFYRMTQVREAIRALQSTLASRLLPAVLSAGIEIMRHYVQGPQVTTKPDGSPVTAADHAAQEILLHAIGKTAPGVPIIAEESSGEDYSGLADRDFFLVDPLDGTREFVSRRPEFTINIALVSSHQPVFGIVYAPALSQLYWTESTEVAFSAIVAPDSAITSIANLTRRQLKTCDLAKPELTVVASRSHGSDDLEIWLKRLPVAERTNIGSSLKFCLIAEGKAHVYPRFGPTMEWDTAAGHALVNAAGGIVTCVDGSALAYGKTEQKYRNPGFVAWAHPEMVKKYATG